MWFCVVCCLKEGLSGAGGPSRVCWERAHRDTGDLLIVEPLFQRKRRKPSTPVPCPQRCPTRQLGPTGAVVTRSVTLGVPVVWVMCWPPVEHLTGDTVKGCLFWLMVLESGSRRPLWSGTGWRPCWQSPEAVGEGMHLSVYISLESPVPATESIPCPPNDRL